MKRYLLNLVLIMVLVLGFSAAAYGAPAGEKVSVTLPAFKVTLNGEEVETSYSQYPLIVYKDITYFPMTYNDCRFLALESYWKGHTEGLFIETTGVTAAFKPYRTKAMNSRYQTAVVPGFPIKINGKNIDNQKEEYPLLSFRDITYFPMTWRFGVDEFGWDYHFDSKNGLVINSDNIKLEQRTLKSNRATNLDGSLKNNVAVTDKFAYYEDSKGQIIQASLADTSITKAVYQLPEWSYGSGDGQTVYGNLYTEGGEAFLFYHQGGATMGTDFLFRLNDDGHITLLNDTRYYIKSFGDTTIKYWAGPAPGTGSLYLKTGVDEWESIGNPDYLYGWDWTVRDDDTAGGGSSDNVHLIGNELYILATEKMHEKGSTTGVYKVNIRNNKTQRISSREVSGFQLEGDYIYYHSGENMYRYSIAEEREELLGQLTKAPNKAINSYVLNGHVFWKDEQGRYLYDMKGRNLNPGAPVDGIKLSGDNNEYLVCTFEENDQSKYRFMVIDKNGNIVFKTSDKAYSHNIYIARDQLYFYNLTSGTICIGKLK